MAGGAASIRFRQACSAHRLQQRADPKEGLVAEQRFHLWSSYQRLNEQPDDVVIGESITVFGVAEFGRRPKLVGCQIGSSGLKPTNQQNSRLKWSCSRGTDGRPSKAYGLQMAGLSRSSA